MARNEDFDNSLWSNPRFEDLSALASLFYIWSWTNTRCGMAGIYEVGWYAMSESKVQKKDLPGVFDELAAGNWAYHQDGVLWVCARVKRLRSRTRQIAVSAVRDVTAITAGHPLRVAWLRRYGSEAWLADAVADYEIDPLEQAINPNLTGVSIETPLSGSLSGPSRTTGFKDTVDARESISELFAYWQQQCGHSHAKLSSERRRKIAGRLREGFTPQQIRDAIDGAARGAFVNLAGRRFDDIELICRNAVKLESFIGRTESASPPENASSMLVAIEGGVYGG